MQIPQSSGVERNVVWEQSDNPLQAQGLASRLRMPRRRRELAGTGSAYTPAIKQPVDPQQSSGTESRCPQQPCLDYQATGILNYLFWSPWTRSRTRFRSSCTRQSSREGVLCPCDNQRPTRRETRYLEKSTGRLVRPSTRTSTVTGQQSLHSPTAENSHQTQSTEQGTTSLSLRTQSKQRE